LAVGRGGFVHGCWVFGFIEVLLGIQSPAAEEQGVHKVKQKAQAHKRKDKLVRCHHPTPSFLARSFF
jgi:hypothetical protein